MHIFKRAGNAACDRLFHAWYHQAREEARNLEHALQEAHQGKIAAEEQCRRLKEQLAEQEQQKNLEISQANNQVYQLTRQVHSLKFCPNPLDDDHVSRTMKRLVYLLDIWIKSNFKDGSRLNALTLASIETEVKFLEGVDEPQNIHQRLALIQAIVSWHIHNRIFSWFVLGAPHPAMDEDWRTVGTEISQICTLAFIFMVLIIS
ncbi:hypothetical protein BDV28DRAFT_145475 [Aspergillus coremiiformis]|uniref:Uncharacterized protein n=1 Tax=Aspergillus coremiiformis TaxID=138285 RepID=A0A5N6ZEN9_9EURO|nr:hypothetical protein BDV28DRAFT_145475 [Aspergillus coremiiformis]